MARLEDIDDMILSRLAERSRREEREWPAAFSLQSDHVQDPCERETGRRKADRTLKMDDQIYVLRLAEMGEALFNCSGGSARCFQ